MKKMSVQQITVLAFCLMLGLCVKKTVSPFTNILTDFFRIPGGSAATGFSLAFLVIGCSCVPGFGAGTLMGLTQGLLALVLGMSGYQGVWCILTYMLPGFMIDLVELFFYKKNIFYFITACCTGNLVSAVGSNYLIFHLKGAAFILWLLMAVCSGMAGGLIGYMTYERVWDVWKKERRVV